MQFSVEGLSSALGFGYHVLVWGIGILAMVLSVISFQFKRGITIVFCNFLWQSSWVAYFLLQGDLVNDLLCTVSTVVSLVRYGKKPDSSNS